jgi:2-dehydropantoate 2-reductase
MKIAIIGAGGIGSYFGSLLARSGNDVTFLARGRRLAQLREQGLAVRTGEGEYHVEARAAERPEDIGPVDLVLLCVKTYDVPRTLESLGPLLGPETRVLPLQNGIGTVPAVEEAVGLGRALGGVAYIEASVDAEGVVHKPGPIQRIVFGPLGRPPSDREEAILETLRAAGIDAQIAPDVRVPLWSKFLFICAMSGLTALTQQPIGPILANPESRRLFEDIVSEADRVARLEGVPLPEDAVQATMRLVSGLPPTMQTSMQRDLRDGRPLELEALNGTVVALARRHGIDVPVNRTVYGTLLVISH